MLFFFNFQISWLILNFLFFSSSISLGIFTGFPISPGMPWKTGLNSKIGAIFFSSSKWLYCRNFVFSNGATLKVIFQSVITINKYFRSYEKFSSMNHCLGAKLFCRLLILPILLSFVFLTVLAGVYVFNFCLGYASSTSSWPLYYKPVMHTY